MSENGNAETVRVIIELDGNELPRGTTHEQLQAQLREELGDSNLKLRAVRVVPDRPTSLRDVVMARLREALKRRG